VARRYAAFSGIAVAALFAVGNAIWALDMPDAGAPAAEIVQFYEETSGRIVAGATLSLLAIAAFVLFAAALRQVLLEAGDDGVLATTAFGGAVLVMAAGLGAETINMVGALRAGDGELDSGLARSVFEISQALGSIASGMGLGLFALATAASLFRTRVALPRWVALSLAVAGVALLTPLASIAELPGALLVAITLTIGVQLLRMPAEA
jgi:hypothetical protein